MLSVSEAESIFEDIYDTYSHSHTEAAGGSRLKSQFFFLVNFFCFLRLDAQESDRILFEDIC